MSEHESKAQVIEKIRKLLRLAKSSNIHEAELAAERASALMEKWRVSAASVAEIDDIRSGRDGIVSVPFVVPNCRMKLKWVETLGCACAALFDGTILVNGRLHGTSWNWVGFASEVPLMEELFTHLWSCYPGIVEHDLNVEKLARKAKYGIELEYLANFTPADTMKYKHGHGQGFALSLYRRCANLRDSRKAAVRNTSTEIVLVRDGALAMWKQKNGIRPAKFKQTEGDKTGFNSGYTRGTSIPLGGTLT